MSTTISVAERKHQVIGRGDRLHDIAQQGGQVEPGERKHLVKRDGLRVKLVLIAGRHADGLARLLVPVDVSEHSRRQQRHHAPVGLARAQQRADGSPGTSPFRG